MAGDRNIKEVQDLFSIDGHSVSRELYYTPIEFGPRLASIRYLCSDGEIVHELKPTGKELDSLARIMGKSVSSLCQEHPRLMAILLSESQELGALVDRDWDPHIYESTRNGLGRAPLLPVWDRTVLAFAVFNGSPADFSKTYEECAFSPESGRTEVTLTQDITKR